MQLRSGSQSGREEVVAIAAWPHMLRARTLVRRLSCGHSSLQYRALLHGLRSASGSAKSVPRAAAATSDAPLQFDESILRMLMREAMEGREGMPQVDGLSTHAQPGRQPGPRKRARISATSQRGVSSSALPALQEVGPSEGTAQSRLAVAQLGPVIEDEHHPLRAGHLPLMTLRILSRLRKAGVKGLLSLCLCDMKAQVEVCWRAAGNEETGKSILSPC